MPSWAGTGIVTICMLTLCRRSANGTIIASPGPRVSARTRPKRKTTPRSNCLMTRTLDPSSSRPGASTAITTNTTIISSSDSSGMASPASRTFLRISTAVPGIGK